MNRACSLCRGACCEAIILPVKFRDEDVQKWFALHGEETDHGIYLEVKCKCLVDGKCSTYEDRPNVCINFPVGSPGCLVAIDKRRPATGKAIRRLIEDTNSNASSKDS